VQREKILEKTVGKMKELPATKLQKVKFYAE